MAPASNPNGVTYRDYCDARHAGEAAAFTQFKLGVDARFVASERAIQIATTQLEHRLELLNEFRAQAADEQVMFARRDMVDQKIEDLDAKIDKLQQFEANIEGRIITTVIGITVVNIIIGVIMKFIV